MVHRFGRFFLFLVLMFVPFTANAEFGCRSELSYKWKRAGESSQEKVVWGVFRSVGVDEATAKVKLSLRLEEEKAAARTACLKEHENLAGCFSVKFSAMGPSMQSLDFASRKSLNEAITSDCNKQQGACSAPESTDPICEAILTSGEGTPAPDAAAAAGKKDDKGKKKK